LPLGGIDAKEWTANATGFIAHRGVDVFVSQEQLSDVGGIPFMMASVVKIRRKSWGAKPSGLPVTSVSPARARASLTRTRIPEIGMGRVSGRWALEEQGNRRIPDLFVVVVGDHERNAAVGVADPADDRGEHVVQFR
jgi:hypothetical protein